MALQLFPLTGGLNQQIDARLLPDGVLANAVNCELTRVGRVQARAKYTALAATSYDTATLTAYDLFSVDDRLYALGDRLGKGWPSDVFEYVNGGAAAWSPTSRGGDPKIPPATRVRDIGRPPDVKDGSTNHSCASVGNYVCLAFNNATSGYVHIFLADEDKTILFTDPAPVRVKAKAIGLSDRFLVLGLNVATTTLGAHRFIPASDDSVATLGNAMYSGLGAISVFAAVKVTGSDQIVVAANCAGTVIVRRFDNTATQITPSGGDYASITAAATHIAVEASSADNQITLCIVVAGEPRLYAFDLTTGATLSGPTVALAAVTATDVTLDRTAADEVYLLFNCADGAAEDGIQRVRFVPSTGAVTTSWKLDDCQLTSHAKRFSGGHVFAMRYGSATDPAVATNLLAYVEDGNSSSQVLLCLAKDFETAAPAGSHLPDLLEDPGTRKWYWANGNINPDADATPLVTELELGSTDRRQTCRFGGLTYIGGALPLVFDTRFAWESGFTERPRIISLTGGSSGALLPSAEYDYRYHEEQVDALGYLHLSPPSLIETVELSSSQSKVTAVVSSSHGLRGNLQVQNIGLAIRGVLSRTLATKSETAAVINGLEFIDPPSATLDGLTLKLMVDDSTGTSPFTVTFDASATTEAQILSQINAITTGRITASSPAGLLVLTADEEGEGVQLGVISGTALTLLGLTARTYEEGTTEITKGENFQRAATGYNSEPGGFVTIVDTRKDESDPIVDSDLIRQQVLYSQGLASGAHHAPPPSDCVWAGKERVGFFRQHIRSRWTASKLIVPAEPAECAAIGFNQFSGQVTGDIEAGAFVGGAMALWTRKQIWLVTGDGPRRNGVGEFNQADCITRSVGLVADGWQSMVQDDEGVWFQGSNTQLYRLGNGGQLEWLGKPVQDYLELYPKVVAAVYRQKRQEVAFAITNANGSAGGILRRNAMVPDEPAWFFDDVGAVTSLAEYQGRLAYVQGGIVYVQDAAPGVGAFPTMTLDSGMFQGFQGLGYGALQELGVLATFRGRCTLTLKIGTNGTTFPDTIAAWALTASEYAVGQRVQLLIDTPQQQYDSFAIRAEVSDVAGDTEGLWLHAFAAKTENAPDFVRLAPSRRL